MNHRFLRSISTAAVLWFAIVLTGTAAEVPPTPDDAREYVFKTVGTSEVKLDVFSPPGEAPKKPRAAMIYFHGGGWVSGDKGYTYQLCRYFAKRGLVVVTANYRFMTKGAPGLEGTRAYCLLDVKSAIRWVRSHAAELGVDPERIILAGSSAGAHLAIMAALGADFDDPDDDKSIPTAASALVLLSPAVAKVPPQIKEPDPTQPYAWLKDSLPPFITLAGELDPHWPDAKAFFDVCRGRGIKGESWLAPGQKHAFVPPETWMDAVCLRADHFLTAQQLIDGPPPAMSGEFVPAVP